MIINIKPQPTNIEEFLGLTPGSIKQTTTYAGGRDPMGVWRQPGEMDILVPDDVAEEQISAIKTLHGDRSEIHKRLAKDVAGHTR